MRNFNDIKRIVIKIGTNTLSCGTKIDIPLVRNIVSQIQELFYSGKQIVMITSGAIGMGAGKLKMIKRIKKIKLRQACAAIGQPLLMHEYQLSFSRYNITIAQILLTAEVLNTRETYLNIRNALETLLKMNVIPIINENDSVSTSEIGTAFGDNDTLSALVASKIDADLLIMLSDIDALYSKDPKKNKKAEPITVVYEITDEIAKNAGGFGSQHATGGMKTKLEAAKILSNTGCRMVLANGRENNIILRIMAGEEIGTVFIPKKRLSNRERWILNSVPSGKIIVDEGAVEALKNNKSLLPKGILSYEGIFAAGSVVKINEVAKAVINMSSEELKLIKGKHSREIRKILESNRQDVVAIPENIVFIED